jgi:hypothetical protein
LSLPNKTTAEGTKSARITVASSNIPMPRPVAMIFRSVRGAEARLTKARNKISAALVISLRVCE